MNSWKHRPARKIFWLSTFCKLLCTPYGSWFNSFRCVIFNWRGKDYLSGRLKRCIPWRITENFATVSFSEEWILQYVAYNTGTMYPNTSIKHRQWIIEPLPGFLILVDFTIKACPLLYYKQTQNIKNEFFFFNLFLTNIRCLLSRHCGESVIRHRQDQNSFHIMSQIRR